MIIIEMKIKNQIFKFVSMEVGNSIHLDEIGKFVHSKTSIFKGKF